MSADFLWQVYGFTSDSRRETVAVFFDWDTASSFAMDPVRRDGFEQRNLYLASPQFDRRAGGYRPSVPLVEFEEIKPGAIAA